MGIIHDHFQDTYKLPVKFGDTPESVVGLLNSEFSLGASVDELLEQNSLVDYDKICSAEYIEPYGLLAFRETLVYNVRKSRW